jgi:hypothetical protein
LVIDDITINYYPHDCVSSIERVYYINKLMKKECDFSRNKYATLLNLKYNLNVFTKKCLGHVVNM